MKQRIEQHLQSNPSYFKWSDKRLAAKFNCSVRTIRSIVRNLDAEKKAYLRSF